MHVLYIFTVCLVLLNLSQIARCNGYSLIFKQKNQVFEYWKMIIFCLRIHEYQSHPDHVDLNGIYQKNFFKENRKTAKTIQKMNWIFCRTFSLNIHICLVLIYLHQIAGCDGYMWISKLKIFNLAVFQTKKKMKLIVNLLMRNPKKTENFVLKCAAENKTL